MRVLVRSVSAFSTLFVLISASGQTHVDFTGHWRLQTSAGTQCQLDIGQNGDTLRVETTVTHSKDTPPLLEHDLRGKLQFAGRPAASRIIADRGRDPAEVRSGYIRVGRAVLGAVEDVKQVGT